MRIFQLAKSICPKMVSFKRAYRSLSKTLSKLDILNFDTASFNQNCKTKASKNLCHSQFDMYETIFVPIAAESESRSSSKILLMVSV